MIAALIAGERDGAKLAELAMGKMRPKVPALTEALAGHLGSHHAVACRRILRHLDFLNESIAALTEQIDQRTAAFAPVYAALLPVPPTVQGAEGRRRSEPNPDLQPRRNRVDLIAASSAIGFLAKLELSEATIRRMLAAIDGSEPSETSRSDGRQGT